MDPDAKYLAGYVLGDGMIKHYRKSGYEVKLTERDRTHVNYLADLVEKVLGVRPSLTRDRFRKAWRIRVYRKDAYEKMKRLVSEAIKQPDPYLIGGLFDAEGDYTVAKRRLRFTNKDPRIVDLVSGYLGKVGVSYSVYERRRGKSTWYVIEIYGKNVFKLLPHLDLRHPKWVKVLTSCSSYGFPGEPRRGWSGRLLGLKRP